MKPFTLSIVIPVHNEEDHIDVCLASISDQTVMPMEVIVVDNNSTDRSAAIAASYDFVRVIKEPKQGIVHARSAGFNAARGDYIGRIDADTVLPEDWVEKALEFMSDNSDTLLTGGCYLYDLGFPRFSGWITEYFSFKVNKLILGEYIAWGSNSVFPAKMWHKVKRDLHLDNSIHEDIDFGIQLINHGYKIEYDKDRKVGIDSRIFSDQRRTREQHFKYLERWPNTLRKHKLKRAWLGDVGMYVVYYTYYPLLITHNLGKFLEKLKPATQTLD